MLVHGEPERNDMVAVLRRATRRVRLHRARLGAVLRLALRAAADPLRRRLAAGADHRGWSAYAQSLTDKPVKGMLTGPVTMLAWSFVRDDQPLADTARQVALALRDEVARPGSGRHPRSSRSTNRRCASCCRCAVRDRTAYLDWAVGAFRLATAGVADSTADPHPPVLLGVRRGDRRDRRPGRRRDLASRRPGRTWRCSTT